MWTEITKEEYAELVKGMKPLESFSDPDGSSPYGNGRPSMDTIWGKDFPVCKCEMRKNNRHELEWEYRYYKNDLMKTNRQPFLNYVRRGI